MTYWMLCQGAGVDKLVTSVVDPGSCCPKRISENERVLSGRSGLGQRSKHGRDARHTKYNLSVEGS
jgi:hypothetical protein